MTAANSRWTRLQLPSQNANVNWDFWLRLMCVGSFSNHPLSDLRPVHQIGDRHRHSWNFAYRCSRVILFVEAAIVDASRGSEATSPAELLTF